MFCDQEFTNIQIYLLLKIQLWAKELSQVLVHLDIEAVSMLVLQASIKMLDQHYCSVSLNASNHCRGCLAAPESSPGLLDYNSSCSSLELLVEVEYQVIRERAEES